MFVSPFLYCETVITDQPTTGTCSCSCSSTSNGPVGASQEVSVSSCPLHRYLSHIVFVAILEAAHCFHILHMGR
jgi:hypothetical protein